MRYQEDLLTQPVLEVELALWVGAASKAYLKPNNEFPIREGAGTASEAGLELNNVFLIRRGAGELNNMFLVRRAGAAEVKLLNRDRPSLLA